MGSLAFQIGDSFKSFSPANWPLYGNPKSGCLYVEPLVYVGSGLSRGQVFEFSPGLDLKTAIPIPIDSYP